MKTKTQNELKKRLIGIGGLCFKTKDLKAAKNWCKKHLGFNTNGYDYAFWWKGKKAKDCSTQWSPITEDTEYDAPSKKIIMCNDCIANLEELLVAF